MTIASPYYPQFTAGPTRNRHHHHYQHRDASSGGKHSTPFYQSTNHHSYSASTNPVVKRIPTPFLDCSLPKDQTDLRVRLFHRLRDGSLMSHMPGGFPFHHTIDGKGKAKVSYEPYDIRLISPDFGPREHIGILFKGPSSNPYTTWTQEMMIQEEMQWSAQSSSSPLSSRYFVWKIYISVSEARSHHSKSSSRSILAQVRVDQAVMHSSYGKFLRTNPEVISRALSISLELGVLTTICIADPESNIYLGSNKLVKAVMTHRKRGRSNGHTNSSLARSCYHVANALNVPYALVTPTTPMIAGDDILYIGTSNHGTAELLYTCPNLCA